MNINFIFVTVLNIIILTNGLPLESKPIPLNIHVLDDMRFPPGFDPKAGVIGDRYRWPRGQLVYELDSQFTQQQRDVIQSGMNEITSKTCITFKPRTTENDYVFVNRGDSTSGCWSYVGRIGSRQELNLQVPDVPNGPSCIFSYVVAHEFIHALGYYHEQSRTDRDDYVDINWNNIYPEYQYAFDKYNSSEIDPFGVPYDYKSIMHYEAYAFAINTNIPTIYPKESGVIVGNDRVSPLDAQKLNNMYNGLCSAAV